MIAGHMFGACLPTFASCADRYCLSGYGGGGTTVEEMLDLAKEVEGLDGLELVGNWHVNDKNIRQVSKMFKDRGFKITALSPDLWTQAKWGKGSLAAPDAKTRRAAVDEIKKVMDWGAELNCPYAAVWPGQDGFDYHFQADYIEAWKWMRDGLAACMAHNDKVTVLVEYKPREPRTHCFVDSAAKVLLLLDGLDKVKVTLDVGHSLQGGENVAQSVALLSHYGKLEYMHFNDNYGSWDDDMIVSSVHVVAYLELVYWLKKIDYKGWLTLDIFPYRENGAGPAIQCREWLKGLFKAIDRVGMDAIGKVIQEADGCKATEIVRKALNL